MRLVSVAALAAVITATVAFTAAPADAQNRRYVRDNSERITFIDQSGRARTKITVRPRSYLDGGTEVVPGERKFMDYAAPVTYRQASPSAAWDPNGTFRFGLPREGDLPGFNPYLPY
jgi:hypothetical protein